MSTFSETSDAAGSVFADKFTQTAENFARPIGLIRNLLHPLPHFDRRVERLLFHDLAAGGRVIGDGVQRLIDLVGQLGDHFSHRAQPHHVGQLRLPLPRFFVRLVAVEDVGQHVGHGLQKMLVFQGKSPGFDRMGRQHAIGARRAMDQSREAAGQTAGSRFHAAEFRFVGVIAHDDRVSQKQRLIGLSHGAGTLGLAGLITDRALRLQPAVVLQFPHAGAIDRQRRDQHFDDVFQ